MNRFLTLLAGTALSITTMAQGEGLKFGAKAGLNMANIVGTDILEASSKTGLHVGPMVNFGLGRNGNFSVLGELLFDMKGCKFRDVPLALNYITVPVMARYRFNFGMYLETGIYFGILMGASVDGESEFDSADSNGNPRKEKVKDSYNGSDLGYTAGIGYIHSSGIGLGYRYNLGLSNINKTSDGFDGSANLNTVGQVSLMYYFGWDD